MEKTKFNNYWILSTIKIYFILVAASNTYRIFSIFMYLYRYIIPAVDRKNGS